jgi:hypothetical protein
LFSNFLNLCSSLSVRGSTLYTVKYFQYLLFTHAHTQVS